LPTSRSIRAKSLLTAACSPRFGERTAWSSPNTCAFLSGSCARKSSKTPLTPSICSPIPGWDTASSRATSRGLPHSYEHSTESLFVPYAPRYPIKLAGRTEYPVTEADVVIVALVNFGLLLLNFLLEQRRQSTASDLPSKSAAEQSR